MKKTIVIAGFPGIGKSTFANKMSLLFPVMKIRDLDSSEFDKKYFPGNYVESIKEILNKNDCDILLISSHDNVRDLLLSYNIRHILVYPSMNLKTDYLKRYFDLYSNKKFIKKIMDNWSNYIEQCENETNIPIFEFNNENETLMNTYNQIIKKYTDFYTNEANKKINIFSNDESIKISDEIYKLRTNCECDYCEEEIFDIGEHLEMFEQIIKLTDLIVENLKDVNEIYNDEIEIKRRGIILALAKQQSPMFVDFIMKILYPENNI